MNDFQKISIVIPTFNRGNFLEETIRSITDQKYPNLELIVIDGGSSDNTLDIIHKYKENIHYWASEPDSGMYHALQKGFEKSSGEIMGWINSDDIYHSGALFTINSVFSNLPHIDWITGIPSFYDKNGQCVKMGEKKYWSRSHFLIGDYKWVQQENVFWKRSLWKKAGSKISTNFKYASDFELWCRFFDHSDLYQLDTSLAGFRLHQNQTSILSRSQYESEASEIYTSYKQTHGSTIRINICRSLFKVKKSMEKSRSSKILSSILGRSIDYFTKHKKLIYFDFEENKWKT